MDQRVKRASGKTGRFLIEIVAAIFVGIGVPLFWIWLGSQIQGARGVSTTVETSTAAIMIVGILVSYLVILLIAGAIQAREQSARRPPTRHPWMRSMRDEPYRPGDDKLSSVEMVFVGTAVVASIAMLIWFFGFAGSPLPS
jgi:hypothetical protein